MMMALGAPAPSAIWCERQWLEVVRRKVPAQPDLELPDNWFPRDTYLLAMAVAVMVR